MATSVKPAPVPNFLAYATTLTRGEKDDKETHSYGGVLHRFAFNPMEEVHLVGLSFFGLPKAHPNTSIEPAMVTIEVEESTIQRETWEFQNLRCLFPARRFNLDFKKEVETVLELPNPVRLVKGTWVEVGFQIDFSNAMIKTEKLKKGALNNWPPTIFTPNKTFGVEITRGKCPLQMPKLHFLLP